MHESTDIDYANAIFYRVKNHGNLYYLSTIVKHVFISYDLIIFAVLIR